MTKKKKRPKRFCILCNKKRVAHKHAYCAKCKRPKMHCECKVDWVKEGMAYPDMKNFVIDIEVIERIFASSNLKIARVAKGLSQAEMARRCGFSAVYYHEIERGLKSVPKKTVEKIEKILA